MPPWVTLFLVLLSLPHLAAGAPDSTSTDLARRFDAMVHPFIEVYCFACHGKEKPAAELDLSAYSNLASVAANYGHWDLVLERIENGEMPNEKAKKFPTDGERTQIIQWIRAMRLNEVQRHAGDPGPVLARRLSNAEYDYTIHDLTGVDVRPTKEFPVDPTNQAGFDNSGESLAMSPALVKKYLGAARAVAEHLILKPDGFDFAPRPVVAGTDRDKYAVLRIVDFYRRQSTDYADYFAAAWRYQNRTALGKPHGALADFAVEAKVSAKYLTTIWTTLNDPQETVGPIAKLQTMWRALPAASPGKTEIPRAACAQMRDFVANLREELTPEVKNPNTDKVGIHSDSQALVLWKNHQIAANRRRYDPSALRVEGAAPSGEKVVTPLRKRDADPDLAVPTDAAERAKYEAAFACFATVFPDAFYIAERAPVYLDAEREPDPTDRLLSMGFHGMTGYFRDDAPLYDLVLDAAGQRELDRLWREFDFASSVPQRMHTSFVRSERIDSSFMRDPEFDPYQPEDKTVTTQEKIKKLAEVYLAKAVRNGASEAVQAALKEHFVIVAANIARVEADRAAAEPSHLVALENFAARAYRRPLSARERDDLRAFYRDARNHNGGDREDAMRDCIARVLMSPNFCYRVDLVEAGGVAATHASAPADPFAQVATLPLSDYALASRLSYFLWASMPDTELLAHAAAGDLHRPDVLTVQARRMLQDSRNRNFALEFAGNWLDFRRFEEHNAVDRDRYSAFDNDLRVAMFEEPIRFFTDVVAENRSVLNFLYGDYTFVNAPLAKLYGVSDAAPAPGEWVRVDHAGKLGRGGLLPMAVFLTTNSPGLRTSPVKRGYWVANRVLGERIPPPPAVVPNLPTDEKDLGDRTLRETIAKHRADKACATCHARFDSLGLVFEGYGAIGERRKKDFGGRPVDTRAEFPGGSAGEGFPGLRDYIRAHRENDFVDNLCRKLTAYALGRTLLPSDDALIADLRKKLAANENRFDTIIECLVTSPQFLTKRAPPSTAGVTAAP